VRVQGWATEIEELALGRGCIACPIHDRRGLVVSALSISGPLSVLKLEKRREELTDIVMEAADRISIRLGYITAPRLAMGDWRPPQPLPQTADGGE
jgi:DNA-binding IclR family transcriptional regulator